MSYLMPSTIISAPQGAETTNTLQNGEEPSFTTDASSTSAHTSDPIRAPPSNPQAGTSTQSSSTAQAPPSIELSPPSEALDGSIAMHQVPEPAHLPLSSDYPATAFAEPHPQPASLPTVQRKESEAIGPSTDTPNVLKPDPSSDPVVLITLLLTTGSRHPYKIDEKYLRKRNVVVEGMNPFNISVYTLKELIWRDWREEWEPRPTSPSSIRLIHFGRLLDDKTHLQDCRFNPTTPNVVHMTVKPQDIVDEEEAHAKSGKGSFRGRGDDEERTSGCRCVIL